jgi:hypothetical protein
MPSKKWFFCSRSPREILMFIVATLLVNKKTVSTQVVIVRNLNYNPTSNSVAQTPMQI